MEVSFAWPAEPSVVRCLGISGLVVAVGTAVPHDVQNRSEAINIVPHEPQKRAVTHSSRRSLIKDTPDVV